MPFEFGLRGRGKATEDGARAEEAEAEQVDPTEPEEEDDEATPDGDTPEVEKAEGDDTAQATAASGRLEDRLAALPAEHQAAGLAVAEAAEAAERARISAIVKSPEATGREASALRLALSGMEPEQAGAVLAELPKKGRSLDERMAEQPQPDVGPGGRPADDKSAARAGWDRVAERHNARLARGH